MTKIYLRKFKKKKKKKKKVWSKVYYTENSKIRGQIAYI